ncbi:MAG: hypothetical protein KAJ75_06145 [Alphaproteobacteria bacterium]|nr:hypothetical protein [Alphaproteobacteria bacterium]
MNEAYSHSIDEIIKVNPDFFSKASTTSSVNGQQEYTLPSDFEKVLMVNWQIAGDWRRVIPMGNADIRFIPVKERSNIASQGYTEADPRYYVYGNAVLGLMPVPTETASSNIKVWYVYTPAQMDDDGDIPDYPDRYHHILKYQAYANYLDQDDEHAAAERMRQRFDAYVQRMVENLEERQVDGTSKSVQISQNVDFYSDPVSII